MANILLFGGSFNPVHFGHLRLAIEGLERFQLDQCWLLPSGTPPHRKAYAQNPEHRLAMLELACQEHPSLRVCHHEIRTQGTNYSVDTVRHLSLEFPQHQFSFLTGLDVVYDHVWRGFEDLLASLQNFLVASRPGYDFDQLLRKLQGTANLEKIRSLSIPLHELSSSLIRDRMKQNRSVHFWLPEKVRVYAEQHRIYQE